MTVMDIPHSDIADWAVDTTLRSDTTLSTRAMLLNMGPSHPAMHGVIRIVLALDGERVEDADIEIGYLHRAFEKESETVGWGQVFPYTDRLNYVSPIINNVCYAMGVEKLLDIHPTERCEYIRVISSEVSRITDHLTCVAASAMELGAMTPFIYLMKAREYLYELIEELTGARLTISYVRIGGVKADFPPGWLERLDKALDLVLREMEDVDVLLTRNRIFIDRLKDVGVISKEDAWSLGFTGPLLRSTGMPRDLRKDEPYSIYDRLDFDVPVGTVGDNYDRYLVRMEEMRQSVRMIRQASRQIPGGPVQVDMSGRPLTGAQMVDAAKMGMTADLLLRTVRPDPTLDGADKKSAQAIRTADRRVSLPPKEDTYGNIEGLMNHFMLIMEGEGIKTPPGEIYIANEAPNGELGFYMVSDGSGRAYRVRCRPPCFYLMQGMDRMIIGDMIADVIATFGTVNMIAGELDR
ncbi:MAG TPA: NADH-quinone oxidoreductase subunit D [Acidobacteriota bacterium]|nr:NADH-quinone oxidoreductase subunit D [Acidobacteriota bacterium]